MVSLRDKMRQLSSRALNKFKPSETSRHTAVQPPLGSVPENPVGGLQLPKDPKLVRRDVHDGAPSYLPAPTASREEVQYFIYAVLTTKVFGCAKACPQWVLETCWACERTGEEFLALTDEAIMTICPMTSRMYSLAAADQKRWNVEQMPSPHARELIGKAILAVVTDRRKSRSSRKDEIQRYWDAERFRDRLNHRPRNGLHPTSPVSASWIGAGQNCASTIRVGGPCHSRDSSYASAQNRGSGQSSACTKSTAATTPTVSEGSSAGDRDRDLVRRHLPDFSETTAKLSNVRRSASLRVRGSTPVLRAKEAFRPSTMRGRPPQLSEMLDNESESLITPERRPMGPAPSLCVEIPNGHMSMDFDLPLFRPHSPGTSGAFLGSRAKSHCSPTSPPSLRGSPRLRNSHLPQQQMSSHSHSDLATRRAWPLRNSIPAGSGLPIGTMQPSIGIEIGHSQIPGPQYSPGTAIQYPYYGVVPPRKHETPCIRMP